MVKKRFDKFVVPTLLFVYIFSLLLIISAACSSKKVTRSYDFSRTPTIESCPPGEMSTEDRPCYEGTVETDDDGDLVLRSACGKYWSVYTDAPSEGTLKQAVMDRVDCQKRNEAVLIYYLNRTRGNEIHLIDKLREGL